MVIFENVTKKYGNGHTALNDIDLTINPGEFVFLVGSSGAGKTSLLRLLIKDLEPTSGKISVLGNDLSSLSRSRVQPFRQQIGFIFQDLKLLFDRTVFENVAVPLEVRNENPKKISETVNKALSLVGLEEKKDQFPVQVSGGELQRTAIARAIVSSPQIILADEPTGNLDISTAWEIVSVLEKINKEGATIIMATHNFDITGTLKKRIIKLDNGKIVQNI